MANKLGISLNHLIRVFKQHSGLTPAQYITRLRINRAKELLAQGERSIIEVCHIAGFRKCVQFL
jgi:transcriptional regulator GlxA family with amidase domain